MPFDVVFLSRIQFGATIAFHYLFPPLTIGLALLMVLMEGRFLWTRNYAYEAMAKFWTRLFGLIFAMGTATGIVMEFQFGTNWATYSRYVGDVFGSALAAEGIFAFFLESGFLAVLVFGWDKVSPAMHFFSTCMVSLGSIFSAIWIVVANSWQQTPAGFHLVGEGILRRAEVTDYWAVVFNPSTVDRLLHTLVGAMLCGGFFVLSVSAYYLLKNRHADFARRSIAIAMPFTLAFALLALVTGHSNGQMIAKHQPGKLAAFEGHFTTKAGGVPLYLWGVPNVAQRRVDFGVAIPGLLSFLTHNDFNAPVTALDDPNIVPGGLPAGERIEAYWPPVQASFQTYHAMVALGFTMIGIAILGQALLWRGRLFEHQWLLRILVVAVAFPILANELGWTAAEIGRQPWIVWGLLKTEHAASKAIHARDVAISIVMFGVIYAMLLATWLFVMDHKIRHGPDDPADLEREARRRGVGWFAIAAERTSKRESMTEAHDEEGT